MASSHESLSVPRRGAGALEETGIHPLALFVAACLQATADCALHLPCASRASRLLQEARLSATTTRGSREFGFLRGFAPLGAGFALGAALERVTPANRAPSQRRRRMQRACRAGPRPRPDSGPDGTTPAPGQWRAGSLWPRRARRSRKALPYYAPPLGPGSFQRIRSGAVETVTEQSTPRAVLDLLWEYQDVEARAQRQRAVVREQFVATAR